MHFSLLHAPQREGGNNCRSHILPLYGTIQHFNSLNDGNWQAENKRTVMAAFFPSCLRFTSDVHLSLGGEVEGTTTDETKKTA